ncbi:MULTISPECIES: hypothetical protein [Citricoccus]|uniref:Uncharacterized protein n=1 Tax=Citricoccus muralis TaxID=169134 RepID=A0ABY8H706_9MICC|nr:MULTISPECIES: hypothetical protein [Citricoccus]WBL19671.1 hypothetical protein O1A05_02960 [Citricoccus sp. NR2]WFP16816.1 hypothetical protein P8192_01420 [Citricoccus muralis]
MSHTRFHRPRLYPPQSFEPIPSGPDPEIVSAAAARLAHALVSTAHNERDRRHAAQQRPGQDTPTTETPDHVGTLVDLVEEIGLDTIAQLWSDAPAVSLGGALWRLYALRTATQRNGELWARWYRAGFDAQVARAIAGVVEPPGALELEQLTEQILTGVYDGDFATALERAGAYCRVTSLGQAHHAESLEQSSPDRSRDLLNRARRLLGTAEELEASASAWRNGTLD